MHVLESTDVTQHRTPEHEVDRRFVERWSPRAMTGEPVSEEDLGRLFEAARWAPSSYNAQPWRILYARRDTPAWERFFDLMVEFNQEWTKTAGALLVFVSRKRFERNDEPAPTHSYDTGAAWMSLALQGSRMGLVVHGMQGFDYDRAREVLGVPEVFAVEAMAAVGHPAPKDTLPEEMRKNEKPSGRKRVEEIAFEGAFPAEASR